jgi:RND family efflux transporter MFP subunit
MMLDTPDALSLTGRQADQPAKLAKQRGKVGLLAAAVAVALLGAGIYGGMRSRADAAATLAADTAAAAVPVVDVVQPQGDAPDQTLALPGQTTAFIDTPIYARTSGYLKAWTFDIGAHVKRGDPLAQIEAPELDQQLAQARAQLAQMQAALVQSQASRELAKVTSDRSAILVHQGWTSRQQGDQDRLTLAGSVAGVNVAQANLQAQQAEVDRLEQLTGFERVIAPFDGVITARNTDLGALINAGAGGPATELFHMTATKTLRIFVAVPEVDSPAMRVGMAATVTLDEYPGEVFHGSLVRTDSAIDPALRTLRVEVDVDNPEDKLLPGAYVFIHFTLPERPQAMTVPANTLLFRSEGLRVGIVRNGTAQLVPITIGRDYGDRVEVLSGLGPTDHVILNPSDSLLSGTAVRLAAIAARDRPKGGVPSPPG